MNMDTAVYFCVYFSHTKEIFTRESIVHSFMDNNTNMDTIYSFKWVMFAKNFLTIYLELVQLYTSTATGQGGQNYYEMQWLSGGISWQVSLIKQMNIFLKMLNCSFKKVYNITWKTWRWVTTLCDPCRVRPGVSPGSAVRVALCGCSQEPAAGAGCVQEWRASVTGETLQF